jgi:hypothetical protein
MLEKWLHQKVKMGEILPNVHTLTSASRVCSRGIRQRPLSSALCESSAFRRPCAERHTPAGGKWYSTAPRLPQPRGWAADAVFPRLPSPPPRVVAPCPIDALLQGAAAATCTAPRHPAGRAGCGQTGATTLADWMNVKDRLTSWLTG